MNSRRCSPQEIEKALERGVKLLQQQAQEEEGLSLQVEDQLLRSIALSCGGDVRKSINTLEIADPSAPIENNVRTISAQQLQSISQRAALRYDKSDDVHYDLLSALQKSIRGSDENAALAPSSTAAGGGRPHFSLPPSAGDCQ